MCGICGVIDYSKNAGLEENIIRRMCQEMKHRGPDGEGIFIKKDTLSVGLGHRRLSIIDLSAAGRQPMTNEDRTVWMTFNGEVYNYKDLRVELENKGHKFQSHTDTETVLHLYEEYGEDCLSLIRGMFAFAIWDEKKKILFAARDRIGKKPFIYSNNKGRFSFASEFNALLASGFIEKEINLEAVHYYLTFGYIPAPLTIYKNVFKLLPAHLLLLKDGEITIKQYWKLDYAKKIDISEQDASDEILRLLKEATKIRLYSDVPLGAFLSGGIDSSTIVGLMTQVSGQRVKTFSIGFEEKDYCELKYARNIAKRFDTEHHELIVKPKALEILPLLVERYGEPYADSSCIPTYYVSEQTKQYVTVALNGDGGDESFAGYTRYQAMLLVEQIPYFLKVIFNNLVMFFPDSVNSKNKIRRIKRFFNGAIFPFQKRYLKWISIFDDALIRNIFTQDFLKMTANTDSLKFIASFLNNSKKIPAIDSLTFTDIMTYLPNDLLVKVDIVSMANSLEVRSPFLDHKLMEFAARLPAEYKIKNNIKKYILKNAVKDLIPRENIHRRKMGFGVPVGKWFRTDLKNFLQEILLSDTSLKRGYFNPPAIKNMVGAHINGKNDYTFQLWSLLMLELWHQRFID